MTDKMANLFVDVQPSNAILTLFFVGNCFLIATIVREYSLCQIILRVLAKGSTKLGCKVLNVHRNSRFVIAVHGICGETNPNIK